MANSLNNGAFQQYWSRRMQMKHMKEAVYRAIANFEEQNVLKDGDTVNRPYRSNMVSQTYVRGQSVSIQDISNTNEQLVVNQSQVVPFYIDDLDELQSNYRFANEFADDASTLLTNFIDSDILAEYINAGSVIDDKVVNGSSGVSGNGISVDTSNIQSIFAAARARFGRKNTRKNLFAVISPDFEQVLVNYLAGKNSNLGDSTSLNGNVGSYYQFDLYVSNNLTWTATLALATQPNDGDTLTLSQIDQDAVVQTQVITFKTVLGATSGNVLIGASADTARANLAALLNAPQTTTANGVALASTFYNALSRPLAAVNVTASSWVTIVGKGQSFVMVSSNLTASGTDGFTAALQVQHQLFGSKGATDIVIQARPKVLFKEVPDKIGKNCLPYTLYGYKTYREGKSKLVDVQVRTDSYVM